MVSPHAPLPQHKRCVYYRFVDPHGNPYKGGDVNALELSSNTLIALFLTKVANNHYPAPPEMLKVYLNRVALNNKELPRRYNDMIGAFGAGSDDKVIVVVVLAEPPYKRLKVEEEETKAAISPFREWFPADEVSIVKLEVRVDDWRRIVYNSKLLALNDTHASQDNQERKANDKIENDQEKSKVVDFMGITMAFPVLFQRLVHGTRQQVFVRSCCEEIFKLLLQHIEKKRPRIAVTRDPGIGKACSTPTAPTGLQRNRRSSLEES